ncbi:MAG: sn-glycerol-1-phosphate dehydrogenase [Anaerolineae bacterium]|jgi:glycerol-1-phosphate dehydrogenase [NAD(P)+]|nr:sn-glycerol-1-phosphate dehydrogenase [Chloroflexota bacterium]
MPEPSLYIGPEALTALLAWLQSQPWRDIALVCDDRTWPVLGAAAEGRLREAGCSVRTMRLGGPGVVADEERIVEILQQAGAPGHLLYLAVGSGTLCDLTRFASHRSGRPFVSLPTAPSVDAYTSRNSPLVLRGLKVTVDAQQPLAVFADLEVLRSAPSAMIAAGAADVLGKYTALADWRLAALLWGEEIDGAIVREQYAALAQVAGAARGIGRGEPEAIAALTGALMASGSAMARWKNSRPASGAEHHLSHYWETMHLLQGRPASLHGAKVGLGALLMARAWARLRTLNAAQAATLMGAARPPDLEQERAAIASGYGPIAEAVFAAQGDLLPMAPERWQGLRERVVSHWDEVLAIAADVPSPEELEQLLLAVGAPTDPAALDLSAVEVADGLRYGHYVRDRFTLRRLEAALGLDLVL